VLVDAQLTLDYARELMDYAAVTGKPVTKCYISHAHPDHFAGAALVDAPTYALASQKELIDRSGDLRIRRACQLTSGREDPLLPPARPVDYLAEAGEEVIDGVRLRLQPVLDAETTEQLTIGLPGQRILTVTGTMNLQAAGRGVGVIVSFGVKRGDGNRPFLLPGG
jgi:glyoxylase-like metal-dependent hydrolase (beta-lactamase superfamily II)